MHIKNFKIISDLVENQSFSRTAKLNGVTQSAVSQKLKSMEKHFNVQIIDRSQRQFRLTPEGKKLYDVAKDLIGRYDQLYYELQEMNQVISGTVHVSTIYSIGLHELPAYLKTFMGDYPSVNVHVEYRRSNLVYDDVLHHSADIGLVAYAPKMRQLEIIPFLEDHLILVCNPHHPLAHQKGVSLDKISNSKLVGFDPDIPTRKATDQIFREQQLESAPVMEFDNIETVKRAVEIDAGVAILPLATVSREISQGLLAGIEIEGEPIKRPLSIIYRKGRVLTPAIKKFIATLTSANGVNHKDGVDGVACSGGGN